MAYMELPDFYLPIQVVGGMPQYPHPICMGLETRRDPSYGMAGATRKGRRHYIFQYTFSGEGVFKDSQGIHRVVSCIALLMASHDPAIVCAYPVDKTEPWKFIFLDFGGQAACAMAQDLIRRHGAIYELPPKHPAIERLLAFHVHDQVGCAISSLEGARLILKLLDALLASKEDQPELKTENQLLRNVHEFVQAHIDQPISVLDIATHFNVSRKHLARLFGQNGCSTPYQYILSSKISAACSLLHAHIFSVKEISNKLGFDTVAHFARTFKRIMRCTPSEYRKIGVLPANTRLNTFR